MCYKTIFHAAALAVTCSFALHGAANADNYPSRPITLVIPYPAGGSVDIVGRTIAPELSKRLGQPVIVENSGGGGGTIGTSKVVRAAPDGYTLLVGTGSEISIAKLTNPAVRYDGQRDLAPISLIGTTPMVLVGHPSVAAKNTDELIALAKTQPGKLNYGSAGIGTPLHLAGELINTQGNVKLTHVPYKGAGAMVGDLVGGQIELGVMVLTSGLPYIKSGKVRPFGITESKRSNAAPDIPSLNESKALEGIEMGIWFGLFTPAKTPNEIQARLHKELLDALKDPAVKAKLAESGVRVFGNSPSEFAEFIKIETEKYKNIVVAADIKE